MHFEHRLLDLLHMQLWFRLFSSIITYAKHESNEKHESNVPKCSGNLGVKNSYSVIGFCLAIFVQNLCLFVSLPLFAYNL